MHFYPHNIADFNNATRHLTRVERSVYRDAIELYYDTELPLQNNFDRLCRVLLCVSEEEKSALKVVLDDFFVLTDLGYTHPRCDAEIEKYRLNSSAKAKAGRASAEARKNKAQHVLNTSSTDEQLTNNQEPITNNQEINKKSKQKKIELDYSVWPETASENILAEWIALRKRKRANVSQLVLDEFGKEFRKAKEFGFSVDDCLRACVKSSWTGFECQWLLNSRGGSYAANRPNHRGAPSLSDDDTSWATPLFDGSYGNPICERSIPPNQGDISGMVVIDQNGSGSGGSQAPVVARLR